MTNMETKALKKGVCTDLFCLMLQDTSLRVPLHPSTLIQIYILLFIQFKILFMPVKNAPPCSEGVPNGSIKMFLPGISYPKS